jgi:hypothetical protein
MGGGTLLKSLTLLQGMKDWEKKGKPIQYTAEGHHL